MKKIQYLLFALLATFVLAGCSEDDVTYTPGEGDQPGNYGVYFPTQANATTCDLDPTDPTTLSYTIKRVNDRGKITVPVVVTASPSNVFEVEPIVFEDGQFEQNMTVNFPEAEVGVTYKVNIAVVDRAYIAVNGSYPTGLDLTVTRAEWKQVLGPNGEKTGKWRDDFLTAMMGSNISENGHPNAEKDVVIWERADKPGYYRIQNIYDETYMSYIIGQKYSNVPSVPTYTIIDATNKEKVWFPYQTTGWEINSVGYDDDGKFIIASFCQENYPAFASATMYGTEVNGVITFPADAIMLSLPSIWEAGSYYRSNTDMTRIMLPGAQLFDYTVSLSKGEPQEGILKISAKLGADVAALKYAFFSGTLSDGDVSLKANDLNDGKIEFAGEITEDKTIDVQMEETGTYTMIGCIYNAEGKMQGYTYLSFGYVKQGDEKPVVITVRTELTWESEAQGHTPENSIKGIIFGQGIESGSFGLFKTTDLKQYPENVWGAYVQKMGTAFTAEQLAAVNGNGFLPLFTRLNKGTSYTLLVYADNGYYGKTIAVEQATQGDPNPLDIIYTADDATNNVPKEDLFNTTWNYYAVDQTDKQNPSTRQYIGKVTFSENPEDGKDEESGDVIDYINIIGLSALNGSPQFTGGDIMTASWNNGQVYPKALSDLGRFSNYYVTNFFTWEENTTQLHTIDYAMLGIYVDKGIIAFVPNPSYVEQGYTFTGIYVGAFEDSEYQKQVGYLSKFKHLLLINPENDSNASTAANVSRKLSEMKNPANYVELRGPELMKALWKEAVGKPINYGKNPLQGDRPTTFETVPARISEGTAPERPVTVPGRFTRPDIRLSSVLGK